MQSFTRNRPADCEDQLWLLEHQPVYTLGQAGDERHILRRDNIPVVRSDRGGQVTYHGPGQFMVYLLADLRGLGRGVRQVVQALEQAVVATLADLDIEAAGNRQAPGVYVSRGGAKIAALGLRVSRGCCYHGLSFNFDMDLQPFTFINPCGFEQLRVTQLREELAAGFPVPPMHSIALAITRHLGRELGYDSLRAETLDWPCHAARHPMSPAR